MLTSMREGIKKSKVLKYFLVLFICAPFAFFGINSYFGNGGSAYAVKVNGDEVAVQVYERELNVQRNQLRQAFGGKIPDGFASDGLLRQQALESVITSQVLAKLLQDRKIVVSNTTLAKAITETEAFQVDGQFDNNRYEAQLRSSGYSVDSFEYQFRQDVAQSSLRDAVVQSNFVLPSEKGKVNNLYKQIREFKSITLRFEAILDSVEVSDKQISEYFSENKEKFTHPERVKIEYIEITPDSILEEIAVSQDDAKIYFDGNKSNYVVEEERSASHILLTLDESADEETVSSILKQAKDIKSQLDAGESFEMLAKEHSQDPGSSENGGSLGFFTRGAMVAAFEDAAFSLEKGSISEPVKSSFGVHIIRVDDIKPEHGKDFSEVKDEIIDLLKSNKSNDIFYDKNEILSNQTYENPDSLVPAAENGNFRIQESDWIDRLTKTGLGGNPKVIAAALSDEVLKDGNNSTIIDVGENHAVVLRIKEHEKPRDKTLQEVSQEISKLLSREIANDDMNELVKKALSMFSDGKDGGSIAGELSGEFVGLREVSRSETGLDRALLAALYKMPRPANDKPEFTAVKLANDDQAVLSLVSVKEPDASDDYVGLDQNLIDPDRIGVAEFQALLNKLRGKAIIEINDQILSPAIQ